MTNRFDPCNSTMRRTPPWEKDINHRRLKGKSPPPYAFTQGVNCRQEGGFRMSPRPTPKRFISLPLWIWQPIPTIHLSSPEKIHKQLDVTGFSSKSLPIVSDCNSATYLPSYTKDTFHFINTVRPMAVPNLFKPINQHWQKSWADKMIKYLICKWPDSELLQFIELCLNYSNFKL